LASGLFDVLTGYFLPGLAAAADPEL